MQTPGKLFFTALLLTFSLFVSAQSDDIYVKVDKMPEFPGGQVALVKYLGKNLKYPASAKKEKISGRVMVAFIIDKNGMVVNPKVTKSLSSDCDREALRVVQQMPNWNPGEKDGKKVDVQFSLPIHFEMND